MSKRNIWTVDPYVYEATASGLNLYDLASLSLINYVSISGGVNSVWANTQDVYVATTASGIYKCSVTTVTGVGAAFTVYKEYPDITHNQVDYIHGSTSYLCAVTLSGVDRYKLSDGTRVYEVVDSADKCYQMNNGDYYYSVNDVLTAELHAVYEPTGGYVYESGEFFTETGANYINDIFVTEGTSNYGGANVIFLATVSGAYVLEERRGSENSCSKSIYLLDT